jgi:hypothetical protein
MIAAVFSIATGMGGDDGFSFLEHERPSGTILHREADLIAQLVGRLLLQDLQAAVGVELEDVRGLLAAGAVSLAEIAIQPDVHQLASADERRR